MSAERNSLACAGTAATKANETPNALSDTIVRIHPPASLERKCRHSIEGCVHGLCCTVRAGLIRSADLQVRLMRGEIMSGPGGPRSIRQRGGRESRGAGE